MSSLTMENYLALSHMVYNSSIDLSDFTGTTTPSQVKAF